MGVAYDMASSCEIHSTEPAYARSNLARNCLGSPVRFSGNPASITLLCGAT